MKQLLVILMVFFMPVLSFSQDGETLLQNESDIKVESSRMQEVGQTLRACFDVAIKNEEFRHKELIRQCFKDHISTSFSEVCEEAKALASYKGSNGDEKIKQWQDKESEVVLNTANEIAVIRQEVAGDKEHWIIPRGEFHERFARRMEEVATYAVSGAGFVGVAGFFSRGIKGLLKGTGGRLNKAGQIAPGSVAAGHVSGGIVGAVGGGVAGLAIGGIAVGGVGTVIAGGENIIGNLDKYTERRQYLVQVAESQDFCNIQKEELVSQAFLIIQDLGDEKLTEAVKNKDKAKIKEYGNPWFLKAVARGNTDLMGALLDVGVDINVKNDKGETPMHKAAFSRQPQVVALLLEKGAKVDARDDRGETPFKGLFPFGFDRGGQEMAELLLQNGANVNATDGNGYTALNYIIVVGDTEYSDAGLEQQVQFLIDKGANPRIKNVYGKSALSEAKKRGYTEIVKLFESI